VLFPESLADGLGSISVIGSMMLPTEDGFSVGGPLEGWPATVVGSGPASFVEVSLTAEVSDAGGVRVGIS
jgi:hypothetical protein